MISVNRFFGMAGEVGSYLECKIHVSTMHLKVNTVPWIRNADHPCGGRRPTSELSNARHYEANYANEYPVFRD